MRRIDTTHEFAERKEIVSGGNTGGTSSSVTAAMNDKSKPYLLYISLRPLTSFLENKACLFDCIVRDQRKRKCHFSIVQFCS